MQRKIDLKLVREFVEGDRYEFYRHALTEAKKDGVEPEDVVQVLLTCKIIEEYPERRRVLVFGKMRDGCPLHVICDFSDEEVMYIPTVYIPAETEWVKYQVRKPKVKKRKR